MSGEGKSKAYIELCERQNQITDRLYEAVTAGKLVPFALVRTASGEWQELKTPARYRETLGGELSLWRGSTQKLELEPGDEWLRGTPLCFRQTDFDEWLAETIVVRPLGRQELPTWWTVPEAAVWIATRDLSKVHSLDGRARAWLFFADEVVSGTFAASFELLAGLRAGRLLAFGWPNGRHSKGIGDCISSEYWNAPTEFSYGSKGVEAVRGPGDAMVGLLLESDEVMAKWESPSSLLDGEKIPLGVAIGRLIHEDPPTYLLRHPEVCLTGLNGLGQRVEIDKDVLRTNSTVNRANHSIATADGRLHWSAVMVELRNRTESSGERASDGMRSPLPGHAPPERFLGDSEIVALAKPVIDRIVSDSRQLRRAHFEPLLRELCGKRLPPKADERLWPQLAPPEWRKSGKRADGILIDDWRAYLTRKPQTLSDTPS